jgi:pimeloyl-ACP methyl ester carboxylesterase
MPNLRSHAMPRRSVATPAPSAATPGRLKLGAVRAGFALGSRLLPSRTLKHAAQLFATPFPSSRTRALAAAMDPAMRRGEIIIRGKRIATYTWGDPVRQPYALMAHGWSSFGLRFQPWVSHLRALGYAVVAFDQPGHGLSGGRYCTLPDFVDTTNELGRCFGRAALAIGHSLGGAALVLAQDQAWQAQKLILLAPAADMVAATDRFLHMVRLGHNLRARFYDWHERHTGTHPQDLQVHRHLPALGQPGLIVHDLDDRDVPWEEGERYARYWPGARLVTTQGLGHHRIVDAPQVIEASMAFLRGEDVGNRVIGSPNLPYGL